MMTNKFVYILEKYRFHEGNTILMISTSCDEIFTYFIREFRKLPNKYGLTITRYEIGKLYQNRYGETIRHIEKENGKIKDLKKGVRIN